MGRKITIKQIGQNKGNYEFWINKEQDGFVITIPGYGGGRDGPMHPNFPEQEKWMRDHSELKEIWYLTWECKSKKELDNFLEKIDSLNYLPGSPDSKADSKPQNK